MCYNLSSADTLDWHALSESRDEAAARTRAKQVGRGEMYFR